MSHILQQNVLVIVGIVLLAQRAEVMGNRAGIVFPKPAVRNCSFIFCLIYLWFRYSKHFIAGLYNVKILCTEHCMDNISQKEKYM